MEAGDALAIRGIFVRIVNVSSLKPVDEDALKAAAQGMKGIITVEEHSIIGGLGSLIADVFRGATVPIRCIGIEDRFGQSAHSYDELLEAYGLTSEHIAATAWELVKGGDPPVFSPP